MCWVKLYLIEICNMRSYIYIRDMAKFIEIQCRVLRCNVITAAGKSLKTRVVQLSDLLYVNKLTPRKTCRGQTESERPVSEVRKGEQMDAWRASGGLDRKKWPQRGSKRQNGTNVKGVKRHLFQQWVQNVCLSHSVWSCSLILSCLWS